MECSVELFLLLPLFHFLRPVKKEYQTFSKCDPLLKSEKLNVPCVFKMTKQP